MDEKKEALKRLMILKANLQTALEKRDLRTANQILDEIKMIYKNVTGKEFDFSALIKPNKESEKEDKNI